MYRRFWFFLTILFIFSVSFTFGEEGASGVKDDFWISLGADAAFYDFEGLTFGGSFSLGYGTGTLVGLKLVWYITGEIINTLELNFILRFYLLGANVYWGPYLQFMGGPSLFNRSGDFSVPSYSGSFSAGAGFGWRFIFGDRWFLEPALRFGYPYFAGFGISAGVRF